MKKNIILLGAGGHMTSVIETIQNDKRFNIVGFLDNDAKKIGKTIFGIKVLGNDKELKKIRKKVDYAFLTVGYIKNINERLELIEKLKLNSFKIPNFVSLNADISKSLKLGKGNTIMQQCLINKNVKMGNFNILNNKSLIEHDVTIGSNVHVATGAIINGNVKIGNNVFIGSGSIIINNVKIKDYSFIKAGSLVKK
jgi:sugar O-acyltransferase (sialic acid O-acetyltransferase NeuD family)